MKFGLCLPYMENDFGRQEIFSWCRAIDTGPFDSLSCGERITGYTLEMRSVLSAAAAITERVTIMPSLYVLPMHSAVWAAKEIATLDVISSGRVRVGVGVGGREVDYRAVGARFEQRHARMDEQVAEMRRIWQGQPAFEGGDEVGPRPIQAGGPPLIAGVMGPKAMRRAAQWADGVYVFSMSGRVEEIQRMLAMAGDAWKEAGRKTPPLRIAGFWYSLADRAEQELRAYVHRYLAVFGEETARAIAKTMTCFEPEAVSRAIRSIRELECDELIFSPASSGIEEVERLTALLADL